MKPNLFHFATSELSQDAFLCWLLSWAKPECSEPWSNLHQVGCDLLSLIYRKADRVMPGPLTSLDVKRQSDNIDILCIINDDTAILIEDKVGTKQHSNQLAIYKEHVITRLGFAPEKVVLIYVQTGDQSDYNEVAKQGYQVLTRVELLVVLESDTAKMARQSSDILDCFALHLRQVEDDVQSYLLLPLEKWTWNSWKGFYSHIQTTLGQGNWDYVSNANGGFLGFWWHFTGDEICEVYLQMEQKKFCFKIVPPADQDRSRLGNEWSARIINQGANHGLRATRPSRIRSGDYMTVAVLTEEFRMVNDNGLIDLAATIEILRAAQCVVDECLIANELVQS